MKIVAVTVCAVLALAGWLPTVFAACCDRKPAAAHDCCNRPEGCVAVRVPAPPQSLPLMAAAIETPAVSADAPLPRIFTTLRSPRQTARVDGRDSYLRNRVLLI